MEANTIQKIIDGLNSQGYLFQQRCIHEIENIQRSAYGWLVAVENHPIAIHEKDTEIDFVLSTGNRHAHIIVECKRANPEYLTWAFTKTETKQFLATTIDIPTTNSGIPSETLRPESRPMTITFNNREPQFASYGLEILTKQTKGKVKPSNTKTINDACYQVLMGLGGFVFEQMEQMRKYTEGGSYGYIPMIITTAKLYLVNYCVSDINLEEGKIATDKTKTEIVNWLVLSYGVPESIRLTDIKEKQSYAGSDPRVIKEKFRTKDIFIVNSSHIKEFLSEFDVKK